MSYKKISIEHLLKDPISCSKWDDFERVFAGQIFWKFWKPRYL